MLNNGTNMLRVTLNIHGKIMSAYAPLDDAALVAEGPMALESGCMGLVREISQELFRRAKGRCILRPVPTPEDGIG
jgi:hypothetical protein